MNAVLIGDHISWRRPILPHHAIVTEVHDDRLGIIHYDSRDGVVEETVTRSEIGEISVRTHCTSQNPVQQVLACARGRIGERDYNAVYNNSEHFATRCMTGRASSSQAVLTHVMRGLVYAGGAGMMVAGAVVGTAGVLLLGPLGIGIGVALGAGGASVIAGNAGVQIAMDNGAFNGSEDGVVEKADNNAEEQEEAEQQQELILDPVDIVRPGVQTTGNVDNRVEDYYYNDADDHGDDDNNDDDHEEDLTLASLA